LSGLELHKIVGLILGVAIFCTTALILTYVYFNNDHGMLENALEMKGLIDG